MRALRTEAPAKLNLLLRVVGRRDDGYHLLESELVLLELADHVALLPGSGGMRVEGEAADDVPLDGSNVAWRGLVAGLGDAQPMALLVVDKRIPVAAGMGGGSSDAAAAWRMGRHARGVTADPTTEELATLSNIGADVPFFAAGVAAGRIRGIGEEVEAVSPHDLHLVLVHPPFGLSTAAVFAELRPEEWGAAENDLLAPARRLRPELDELMAAVRRAGGDPKLTGSGPTLFATHDDPERARALADALEDGGIRTTLTRTRTEPPPIEELEQERDGRGDPAPQEAP